MANNVFVMNHPLIQHKLTFLRDKSTGTQQFRALVSEIANLMCYEATRDLPLLDVETETPICTATTKVIAGRKLAFVPILRAGLGMVDGVLQLFRVQRSVILACTATRRPCSRWNTTISFRPIQTSVMSSFWIRCSLQAVPQSTRSQLSSAPIREA